MDARENGDDYDEKIHKEVPQLVEVLKEMKEGLDNVTSKVQALVTKVKAKQFPTEGGISYLEAKHLLLVSYCQSLVYYLLHKAKGLSIEGHPVVRSLVEIRLFLEKIRPIDKKCGYRIERLIAAAASDAGKAQTTEKTVEATKKSDDLLTYRPNPDMIVGKTNAADDDKGDIYRPPKFARATMENDKKTKEERNAQRKEKDTIRRVRNSEYARHLVAEVEDRPEELRETYGAESRELTKFSEKWDKREQQEEELFNRVSITKAEKKKIKSLTQNSNGLRGLADDFYDEIKSLPLGDADEPKETHFGTASGFDKKLKKRKRKF